MRFRLRFVCFLTPGRIVINKKKRQGYCKITAPIPQNPVADNKIVIKYLKQNYLKINSESITVKGMSAIFFHFIPLQFVLFLHC